MVNNRQREEKTIQPEDEGFSGVVFKVQANMDANHRDRIAFVRVASGKYTPGMKLKVQRTGKELRPTSVVTFMSQRRGRWMKPTRATSSASPPRRRAAGRHHHRRPGLQFTGLPFFAPEMFMTVVLKNPLRTKQLQQGLAQLGEEGAIQVFKPDAGGNMLLGAVGQLQFEVVQHRLKPSTTATCAWKAASTPARAGSPPTRPAELRELSNAYPLRLAHDAANTLAYLCTSTRYAPSGRLESTRHRRRLHRHPTTLCHRGAPSRTTRCKPWRSEGSRPARHPILVAPWAG